MQKLLTIITLLVFSILTAHAQTDWQWGKRGGSAASGTTAEGEVEMVTDQKGNLYVLAVVSEGQPANIDGNISPHSNNRLSLTKWGCDGSHKWTKYFGSTAFLSAVGSSLAIDSLGGLYFAGTFRGNAYFDIAVAHFNSPKTWFVAKYDTSGVFQWLELPQADTVTSFATGGTAFNSAPIGLEAAPNGDVYILAHLAPGVYSGSYLSLENDFHLMRYNRDGNFLDAKVVDMSVSMTGAEPDLVNLKDPRLGFARDHNSGRFYISGWYNSNWGSLTFGTTSLQDIVGGGKPMYLSAFDSNGNHLWVEQSDPALATNVPYSRPRIDEEGNIYICGGATQGNTFFGHSIVNSHSTTAILALFILSVDSDGNLRWAINSGNDNTVSDLGGLAYANGIISVSDAWQYFLSWGQDSLLSSNNGGGNHLSRFNAHTGHQIKNIDTFKMTGPSSGTSDLVANRKGNIYVGGRLASQVFLPSVTLTNMGGTFDFFVAKYGAANCNCSLATPDFTSTSAPGSTTVNFSYTGSTPIDSVRWEFGDGAMASGLTSSHTYTAAGTYGVSIVVYNACGIVVHYKDITTGGGTGINNQDFATAVSIYPNPSTETIIIEGAGLGTEVELYNTIGQRMLGTTIISEQQSVDVSSLSNGMYIIHFMTKEGKKGSVKMLKQ